MEDMTVDSLHGYPIAVGELLAGISVQVYELDLAGDTQLLRGIQDVVKNFVDENAISDGDGEAIVVETGLGVVGIPGIGQTNPDLAPDFVRPRSAGDFEGVAYWTELVVVEIQQARTEYFLLHGLAIRHLNIDQICV